MRRPTLCVTAPSPVVHDTIDGITTPELTAIWTVGAVVTQSGVNGCSHSSSVVVIAETTGACVVHVTVAIETSEIVVRVGVVMDVLQISMFNLTPMLVAIFIVGTVVVQPGTTRALAIEVKGAPIMVVAAGLVGTTPRSTAVLVLVVHLGVVIWVQAALVTVTLPTARTVVVQAGTINARLAVNAMVAAGFIVIHVGVTDWNQNASSTRSILGT
jgi:hypothetical protein